MRKKSELNVFRHRCQPRIIHKQECQKQNQQENENEGKILAGLYCYTIIPALIVVLVLSHSSSSFSALIFVPGTGVEPVRPFWATGF